MNQFTEIRFVSDHLDDNHLKCAICYSVLCNLLLTWSNNVLIVYFLLSIALASQSHAIYSSTYCCSSLFIFSQSRMFMRHLSICAFSTLFSLASYKCYFLKFSLLMADWSSQLYESLIVFYKAFIFADNYLFLKMNASKFLFISSYQFLALSHYFSSFAVYSFRSSFSILSCYSFLLVCPMLSSLFFISSINST